MVKDFPHVGFDDIAVRDGATRDEYVPFQLRLRAAGLIERGERVRSVVAYWAYGALARLLYRVADLLDRTRF